MRLTGVARNDIVTASIATGGTSMLIKRNDVEYLLHDFLEIHFGTNELENSRIVRFIQSRLHDLRSPQLYPVSGFSVNGLLVVVTLGHSRPAPKELLLLDGETREKTLYQCLSAVQKFV